MVGGGQASSPMLLQRPDRAERGIADTKISVIIPVYDEIALALRAIRSVQTQTHRQLEAIVVDDGSTEDTEPLRALAAADDRVKILRIPNAGPGAARNAGLDNAAGEYIAFLDADDWFVPTKLRTQLRYMQEQQSVFSHTSYSVVHASRDLGGAVLHSGAATGKLFPEIISNCPISTPTVMMHAGLVQNGFRFPEHARIGEDCLLWISVAREHEIHGLDLPLTVVEWSDTSAAINLPRSIQGLRSIRDALGKEVRSRAERSELKKIDRAICRLQQTHNFLRERYGSDVNYPMLEQTFSAPGYPLAETESWLARAWEARIRRVCIWAAAAMSRPCKDKRSRVRRR